MSHVCPYINRNAHAYVHANYAYANVHADANGHVNANVNGNGHVGANASGRASQHNRGHLAIHENVSCHHAVFYRVLYL